MGGGGSDHAGGEGGSDHAGGEGGSSSTSSLCRQPAARGGQTRQKQFADSRCRHWALTGRGQPLVSAAANCRASPTGTRATDGNAYEGTGPDTWCFNDTVVSKYDILYSGFLFRFPIRCTSRDTYYIRPKADQVSDGRSRGGIVRTIKLDTQE